MKKTYRADDFSSKIDVFDVVKETKASVWVKTENSKTEQFRKISYSFRFFDTLNEAKKYLTGRYIDEIEYHNKQIEISKESIKKVQAIE